jgi:hypothetical protein
LGSLDTIEAMAEPTVTDIPELTLAYVEAVGGLTGAGAAFDELDQCLGGFKGWSQEVRRASLMVSDIRASCEAGC